MSSLKIPSQAFKNQNKKNKVKLIINVARKQYTAPIYGDPEQNFGKPNPNKPLLWFMISDDKWPSREDFMGFRYQYLDKSFALFPIDGGQPVKIDKLDDYHDKVGNKIAFFATESFNSGYSNYIYGYKMQRDTKNYLFSCWANQYKYNAEMKTLKRS